MKKTWATPGGSAPRLCLDILRQPHTLIAGATGSGKSTVINAVIYTALYRAPCDVKFVLIDTKRTELYKYKNLPHTMEYIRDPSAALDALRRCADEIIRRSDRAARQGLAQSAEPDIYIIIDELGDLIYSNRAVTGILGRIAMIGRSANVHLIAGTQCPNRRTLSPEFAANCTGRVALRCGNPIESRQIIGCDLAVGLPQYGQCYYQTPQYQAPQLVTVRRVDDAAIAARVQHWTQQTRRRWFR